ncbi:unnamed protein product [Caenorhabditis sp. 36 PRJEB53466]|nr:unnamed protein product [Caenorhabditis sp. 36 PRJEB53466]
MLVNLQSLAVLNCKLPVSSATCRKLNFVNKIGNGIEATNMNVPELTRHELAPREVVLLAASSDAVSYGQEETNYGHITIEWTNNTERWSRQTVLSVL